MKIIEIFSSIQGESSLAGTPTVFIRTSGCNLRCEYCDSTYAYSGGEDWSVDRVVKAVQEMDLQQVCITGGEPLLQPEIPELCSCLLKMGLDVSLETNGSLPAKGIDPRVKKIFDVKTPDSSAANSFLKDNLEWANSSDEFKFVICSERDFEWAENFMEEHALASKHLVLYSPSFGKISEKWLAKKMLLTKSSARLQLQLHKYIWSADTRGV